MEGQNPSWTCPAHFSNGLFPASKNWLPAQRSNEFDRSPKMPSHFFLNHKNTLFFFHPLQTESCPHKQKSDSKTCSVKLASKTQPKGALLFYLLILLSLFFISVYPKKKIVAFINYKHLKTTCSPLHFVLHLLLSSLFCFH